MRVQIKKRKSKEEIQNELCGKCSSTESGIITMCNVSRFKARVITVFNTDFSIKVCSSSEDFIKSKKSLAREVEALARGSQILKRIEGDYRSRLSNLAHNLDKYAGAALQTIDQYQHSSSEKDLSLYDFFLSKISSSPEDWTQFIIDLYKAANAITIEIGAFRKLYEIEELQLDSHNLHGSTMNVVYPYMSTLKSKNITIIPGACYESWIFDYQIFHAALFAVLENCKKYCKTYSKIYVNFHSHVEHFEVGLKMVSRKIGDDEVENIFLPNYRSKNVSKRGLEGTGIGLYAARLLLQKMGGDIYVRTQPYQGDVNYGVNEFVIRLPQIKGE